MDKARELVRQYEQILTKLNYVGLSGQPGHSAPAFHGLRLAPV